MKKFSVFLLFVFVFFNPSFSQTKQDALVLYNNGKFREAILVCEAELQENPNRIEIMNVLNSRVLMKQTITKSYEEISFFFQNWKKIIIKQNEIAKNHFKDFFKYINLEGQAYSSLIAEREELKQKYMIELAKLNAKKEKLFSGGDLSKFELNPDDRTIDFERLKRDKPYAMENMCYKEGIYNGEEYIENDDGEYAHWECVDYGRDLVEFLGFEIELID